MLSINNQALPKSGSLTYTGFAGTAGGEPTRLRLAATWPALTSAALAAICALAKGSFTLGCTDPRSNQPLGFPARLTAIDMTLLHAPQAGQALWRLQMTIDQAEP